MSSTNGLKLTDINFDCLERIFAYTSINDLVSVAHANKQLKSGTDLAFVKKYRVKKFEFTIRRRHPSATYPPINNGEVIIIQDLQTVLRLLRSFGHLITKMKLYYPQVRRPAPIKVLRYANVYCSALTDISFHNIFNYAFEWSLIKPFPNVKNVTFDKCQFGVKISKFSEWFPAMTHLNLFQNSLSTGKYLRQKFNNLKHLVIYANCELNAKHLLEMIRHNPQLCYLSLDRFECVLPIYFEVARTRLTELKHLVLRIYPNSYAYPGANFKTVKILEITVDHRREFWSPIMRNLSFDQIEEITLCMCTWNQQFVEFLQRHKSITKFTLRSNDSNINEQTLINIADTLPLLKEFNIFDVTFDVGDIVRFVDSFSLFSYGFSVRYRFEVDRLKEQLGDQWNTSVDNSNGFHMTMKRKI